MKITTVGLVVLVLIVVSMISPASQEIRAGNMILGVGLLIVAFLTGLGTSLAISWLSGKK